LSLPWYRYADNVAYLCRDMTEGGQVLKEVNDRLKPLGMRLKGKDGVKGLASGEEACLLGFALRRTGKVLHCGTSPGALDDLRQHLGQAHVAPNPARTARDAVTAWVEAYAPAFEDGDVADVLATAAQCGFRELISLDRLRDRWQAARGRWNRCRAKARRRHPNGCQGALAPDAGRTEHRLSMNVQKGWRAGRRGCQEAVAGARPGAPGCGPARGAKSP
jgi:hypothetical protein